MKHGRKKEKKQRDTEREKTEAYGPFEVSRGNRHISGKSLCLNLKWRMLVMELQPRNVKGLEHDIHLP